MSKPNFAIPKNAPTASKFERVMMKVLDRRHDRGAENSLFERFYFSPSIYGETNEKLAGSLGGALDRMFLSSRLSFNDTGCDILAIAGISSYIVSQKERNGNTQLTTIMAVNPKTPSAQSYSLFISATGELVVSYALDGHIEDDREFTCFLVPVYDSNGWGCTWIKITPPEMKQLMDDIKNFVKLD